MVESRAPPRSGEVVVACGTVIDATDSRRDSYAEGRALFADGPSSVGLEAEARTTLDAVADLAQRTSDTIDRLDPGTG